MRIALITSSLEPGQDGVGDYSRRLGAELIRRGNPCVMVGLNDANCLQIELKSQVVEGISVPVMRLPRFMPWDVRTDAARDWLAGFKPDWISLQFVPFGFHPKGLCRDLVKRLIPVVGFRPLHWMFHELWVLWKFPLRFRDRLLGQIQKVFLRVALRKLRPQVCATQLPLYQTALSKIGVVSHILPLHGNIPLAPREEAAKWLTERLGPKTRPRRITAGFFGAILSTLNVSMLHSRLAELASPDGDLILLSAGKIGEKGEQLWDSLKRKLKIPATFVRLGELNEFEASLYFSALDCGLTAYPAELMGKSGSVAAMSEHGLRIISCGSFDEACDPELSHGLTFSTKQPWTVQQSASALLQQLQGTEPNP